jgi:hypothetical protein
MATEKYRRKMRWGPAKTRGRLNPGTGFIGPHGSRGRWKARAVTSTTTTTSTTSTTTTT